MVYQPKTLHFLTGQRHSQTWVKHKVLIDDKERTLCNEFDYKFDAELVKPEYENLKAKRKGLKDQEAGPGEKPPEQILEEHQVSQSHFWFMYHSC